jgi:O-antigen ligase
MSSLAPEYFLEYVGFAEPETAVYRSLVNGTYATSSHNIYLEMVVEHGLLGLVAVILFVRLILRNWNQSQRAMGWNGGRVFAGQTCVYSILLGLGFFYAFESSPTLNLYFLFLMLLHLTFVLNQPEFGYSGATRVWLLQPGIAREPALNCLDQ